MENDLGGMLQSVLSDPEQMERIASMAQSLMGDAGNAAPQESTPVPAPLPKPAAASASLPGEEKLLSALTRMLGGRSEQTRSTALLTAMRPYMKAEKQEKLDRAMQAARMVRIAGAVMKELGGGEHGI